MIVTFHYEIQLIKPSHSSSDRDWSVTIELSPPDLLLLQAEVCVCDWCQLTGE